MAEAPAPSGITAVAGAAPASPPGAAKGFTPARVLEAIGQLYAPGGSPSSGSAASKRGAADRYLSEFQRSDACVLVAFQLLASQDASHRLPPEAALLLASAARRRLQRGPIAGASSPEETLKLAILLAGPDPRAAELLVHAAVAQWLHSGVVPAEALLLEAGRGQGAEAGVALAALAALPEELNAREVRLDPSTRAELLLSVLADAPKVLAALGSGSLAAQPAGARIAAAAKWCLQCDLSAEAVATLATSPLLPLAGEALARGPPDSVHGVELLETLLERSGSLDPCPEALVDALLRVLSATQPAGAAERGMLCGLVAAAVNSWCRFFVAGGETPPAAAWVGLLEALVACSSWGFGAASATLSTWLALREHAVKVGAGTFYQPVLASAVRALRSAAVFSPGYPAMEASEREDFLQYRRELRDALRALMVEAPVRQAFVEEIRADIAARIGGPWEPLEESVHALSAPAAAICRGAGNDAPNTAAASVVLETLSALAADGSPLLAAGCHRQLACTFVMTASVYAAIFGRAPPLPGGISLTARVLALARGTLGVRERPAASEGVDAIFPFTVKQDHIGVVCLLRLCSTCFSDPALSSQEAVGGLLAEVRRHLALGLCKNGDAVLEEHSTVVLAEAVACLATHHAESARELLASCLELVADGRFGGAGLALLAAAEVLLKCGRAQGPAVAAALAPAWPALAEPRLEAAALARLLSVAAENTPVESMQPLAQLLAGLFKSRPEARAPLLKAATSFMHRAGREGGPLVALAAELLGGISAIAWAEVEQGGRALARLQLATDCEVRAVDEAPPAEAPAPAPAAAAAAAEALEVPVGERALVEAWAHLVNEAAKHAPAVLASPGTGLAPVLTAAASLAAALMRDPPASSLALLAHEWKDSCGLAGQCRDVLGSSAAAADAAGPWPLGAVVLRAVMKALLGQMPPNALGVLVPAARAVFQHDAVCAEAWLRRALAGGDFPAPGAKPEAKERLVKELLGARTDVQKFKQALKKFCAGKKK